MAFNFNGFSRIKGSSNSSAYQDSNVLWTYTSLPNSSGFRDDFDTIFSDGYFDNVSDELSVGDGIYITSSEGSTFSGS